MSALRVFSAEHGGDPVYRSTEPAEISAVLGQAGIRFEQWDASQPIEAGASQEEVLAAYAADIERLQAEGGYGTVDVISVAPDHPEKEAMREKFLEEHIHTEDEVRFFVDGQGLFTLHVGETVYEILCTQGDLISVPANTPHWFDMGPEPSLVAIRFFNNPEGWVAHYTGDDIAQRFPRLELG